MKILEDVTLPGREGGAWLVRKDQHIRILEVEGGAIGDFVCFNANQLSERFSQARTKANQGKFLLSPGDHLYSRDNNPILTITEDTYGIHDLQYGMCSAWVFQNFQNKDYHGFSKGGMGVGGPLGVPPFGCYEVLQKALAEWPIEPQDIPDPINLFQTLEYDCDAGTFILVDGRSKPGDFIDFVAQMDALCALSACPSMGRALRIQVYDA
ncbi:MAG: urea carboxylase-associated family protein [Fimbriimonadaceae bacterium]|nr:urea carboxylase-associated family protein [Alphaproteobacteria bacterium]